MEHKRLSVHYNEKGCSIGYKETPQNEAFASEVSHVDDEFVRFQEISGDCWSSKYYYIMSCILIATGNEVVSMSINLANQLSGGFIIILLLILSLLIGLPLIYMETFCGRYTRLTNSQIYRMTPIFFGIPYVIFLLNIIFYTIRMTDHTHILVNLLKLLVNPDINSKCIDNNKECYDYKIKGPIKNDTCRYGYISIICEKLGEVRYPMEYQYWKMYKDPNSTAFPYYQVLTGVVISWGLVLVMIMKPLEGLGWLVHTALVTQVILLTIAVFLAMTRKGSLKGFRTLMTLSLDNNNNFTLSQFPHILWYSLMRLGLIIPSGFMTFSAYAKFQSNLATECLIIVMTNLLVAICYLTVSFVVGGVLANAIGVEVEAVLVPNEGLFLTVLPEFLVYLQIPNIYLILYYGSLWFFETAKTTFFLHMLILNLFDYFPAIKGFSTYIWVTSITVLCFISIPACSQLTSTSFATVLWMIYSLMGFGILLVLEITMVFYFYGVERFCDDIHFVTGQKPMQFWRIMWYAIPVVGWIMLFMSFPHFSIAAIEEQWSHGITDYTKLYGNIFIFGLAFVGVIATIMNIVFYIGQPNLLLTLLKPQYFWGPPEKDLRKNRKNFRPKYFIRSQRIYSQKQLQPEELTTHLQGVLISEFSKDVLQDSFERGDILKDKFFFDNIGVQSERSTFDKTNRFLQEKAKEVDIQQDIK